MVEPTRKSTRVTVAPPKAAALAVSVGDVPSATEAPLAWLAMVIVGTDVATVTLTAAEVTVVPVESVTRAVRVTAPAFVGVHATVYGATVAGVPMCTPPAK